MSIKATTKAASAVIIAIFMAAVLFGAWLIVPANVEAAESEENATTSNVTVKAYVACGMPASYANGVEFGSLDPATSNNLPSDTNYTMSAPTTNNVGIDFYIKASAALTKGGDTIPLANYTYNMTANTTVPMTPVAGYGSALTTEYVEGTLCDNTLNGSKCYLHAWLDIPANQPAGTYSNTVTVKCNATD